MCSGGRLVSVGLELVGPGVLSLWTVISRLSCELVGLSWQGLESSRLDFRGESKAWVFLETLSRSSITFLAKSMHFCNLRSRDSQFST